MHLTAALLLLCAGLSCLPAAAASEDDAWSGRYRLTWLPGTPAADARATDQILLVARAPDADPAKLAEERRADLARWTITPRDADDSVTLNRFLPDGYEAFGWTAMHAADAIACLDGGRMFLCRVKPGTTVVFGREGPGQERLQARTGFFGVVLHAGGFELTQLDSIP